MNALFANFADGHHMDVVEIRETLQVCNINQVILHNLW